MSFSNAATWRGMSLSDIAKLGKLMGIPSISEVIRTDAPANPVKGDTFYDAETSSVKVYGDGLWVTAEQNYGFERTTPEYFCPYTPLQEERKSSTDRHVEKWMKENADFASKYFSRS